MGLSKITRFLLQNREQRLVINSGGGGVEDHENHFRQADGQNFDVSTTKTGPQGWDGSWPRFLAISMAGWLMGPPVPCSSAPAEDSFCWVVGAPTAPGGPETAACPTAAPENPQADTCTHQIPSVMVTFTYQLD